VGHLVVVDDQQIPRLNGEVEAQLRIIEDGIEGIEGFAIGRLQELADQLVAPFDPVAQVAQGGAIAGVGEDRKAQGFDPDKVVAGSKIYHF
jgi:hypothetical protein